MISKECGESVGSTMETPDLWHLRDRKYLYVCEWVCVCKYVYERMRALFQFSFAPALAREYNQLSQLSKQGKFKLLWVNCAEKYRIASSRMNKNEK